MTEEDKKYKDYVYYSVPLLKLFFLSIVTLNIYQIYIIFKQWEKVKMIEKTEILPLWRAIFSVIFIFPLSNKIWKTAKMNNIETHVPFWFPGVVIVFISTFGNFYNTGNSTFAYYFSLFLFSALLALVHVYIQSRINLISKKKNSAT